MVVPTFATLYQLYVAIDKWKRIDLLNQWISERVHLLYFLSIITGSAFAGIELCTSNLFNLTLFQMPLSKTRLLRFKTKRIYSTVMFEVKIISIHFFHVFRLTLLYIYFDIFLTHSIFCLFVYVYTEYPSTCDPCLFPVLITELYQSHCLCIHVFLCFVHYDIYNGYDFAEKDSKIKALCLSRI